jgi:hypothetical protein
MIGVSFFLQSIQGRDKFSKHRFQRCRHHLKIDMAKEGWQLVLVTSGVKPTPSSQTTAESSRPDTFSSDSIGGKRCSTTFGHSLYSVLIVSHRPKSVTVYISIVPIQAPELQPPVKFSLNNCHPGTVSFWNSV